MKKTKLENKLTLNKVTVSDLDLTALSEIKGGSKNSLDVCTVDPVGCPRTYPVNCPVG